MLLIIPAPDRRVRRSGNPSCLRLESCSRTYESQSLPSMCGARYRIICLSITGTLQPPQSNVISEPLYPTPWAIALRRLFWFWGSSLKLRMASCSVRVRQRNSGAIFSQFSAFCFIHKAAAVGARRFWHPASSCRVLRSFSRTDSGVGKVRSRHS